MRRVLSLAVVALALPAFAGSITFYGSPADAPYVGGGATMWRWEHSTGNPAWGKVHGGGALSKEGAFAFNVTGWTDASTNIVDYAGGGLFAPQKGSAMSDVHSPRLNLISGNSNGRLYHNGHGRSSENVRTTVPEPETLGLLGTGLFFIGGLVRRKMKMREPFRSSHNL
jgi:hypothetical protein